MARPLRIQYQGAFYHVMNRGGAKKNIFLSHQHYQSFLQLLDEAAKLWEFRVHAFSLMSNHYHLLIETPLGNLSRCMRHINGVYTQRFNRILNVDGQLFRGRYKAILVEEEAYLVELLRYIHLNPVLANIVTRPQDYPWSSHRYYLDVSPFDWLATDYLLKYFGRRTRIARQKLHKFVLEGVPSNLREKLANSRWPSVYSSANFEDLIHWNFVKDLEDKEVKYESHNPKQYSEESIKTVLCDVLGTEWTAICHPRNLEDRKNRSLAIWFYRKYLKKSYPKLSQLFGGLSSSRISRILSNTSVSSTLIERIGRQIQKARVKT